jgi:hypothetical protein
MWGQPPSVVRRAQPGLGHTAARRKRRIATEALMPDKIPSQPAPVPPPPPPSRGPTINIADEFGTAKRNLPPAKILLIAIAAVAVVVVVASFLRRAKPQGSGSSLLAGAVRRR